MSPTLGPLPNKGRVVIIGGGPGGTGCALALQTLAAQMNHQINITILEGKTFDQERQYNQCVGVLSPPLPELFEEQLNMPFPHHLCQRVVDGYVLNTKEEQIPLTDKEKSSFSLRRVQFDNFMLDKVKQRGIPVIQTRAIDLEFHSDWVMVYTDSAPFEADVVVGAFGLDEGSGAFFARQTAYKPPKALSSVVTKYHPGDSGMNAFGSYIQAFLPTDPRIEFGAVTPKLNHLTVNIAGNAVDVPLMRTFLNRSDVRAVLPNLENAGTIDPNDLRFFMGRFPRTLARGYYGDRYVMVGDAAGLVRAFKGKGVTSAVQTGIRAAQTILQHGISYQAFHKQYRRANRDIISDLPYGSGIRLLTILMSRARLLDPIVRAAQQTTLLQSALFDAVSAHASYRKVINQTLNPKVILKILREIF